MLKMGDFLMIRELYQKGWTLSAISEETSAASSNVAATAVTQLDSVKDLDSAASNLAMRAEELTKLLEQFTL